METLILLVSLVFVLFYNTAFFCNVLREYALSVENIPFIISLGILLYAVTVLFLGLLCFRRTVKPVLVSLFVVAAAVSYFMNRYNIVMDTTMIGNVLATDHRETLDLVSVSLVANVFVLGIVPAWWLASHVRIVEVTFWHAVGIRLGILAGAVGLGLLLITLWSQKYASFFREHEILRYYTNPVTTLYSIAQFGADRIMTPVNAQREPIGMDARKAAGAGRRKLLLLVVGETARADHFSLFGYARETNPELSRLPVIPVSRMRSCATATAQALPCMFSSLDEAYFSVTRAGAMENLLDVVQRAGGHVLWRDNNSNSKGIAQRVTVEDFRTPTVNPVCEVECRDVGMLAGLDDYIAGLDGGDIVIVLHQMGNHGPAYYKRYPQAFESFTPVCRTNDLGECTRDEIINAYDNAILYTDYFLSRVIDFLEGYSPRFDTAMFYVSDHGESLGEYGLYLHGLPNVIAPDEQRWVPAIAWFGDHDQMPYTEAMLPRDNTYSHDDYFHTVLGLLDIETSVYQADKDIFRNRIQGEP